ncbi:hypothetical protein JCM6882_007222 [Rhodosporidiobolus microsporus]
MPAVGVLLTPFHHRKSSRALRVDTAPAQSDAQSPPDSPPLSPPSCGSDPFAPTSPLPPPPSKRRTLPHMLECKMHSAPPRLTSLFSKSNNEEGEMSHGVEGKKRFKSARRGMSAPSLRGVDEDVEEGSRASTLAGPPQTANFSSSTFDLEMPDLAQAAGVVVPAWSPFHSVPLAPSTRLPSNPASPFLPVHSKSTFPPSPASPSFPFPRMPLSPSNTHANAPPSTPPSKAARPPLISAFTTCTTVRAGGMWQHGSSSSRSSTPLFESSTPLFETGVADDVRTPPRRQEAATKSGSNPSLPPTPPATSPRRRPPHLNLDSFVSTISYAVSDDDENDASSPSRSLFFPPSSAPVAGEFDADFLAEQDDLSLSSRALDAFEDGDEFPWRWSSSFERNGGDSNPTFNFLQRASTGPPSVDGALVSAEGSRRRRTVGNGELARIRETLADVAVVLHEREASSGSKRSAVYVPSTTSADVVGDDDLSARPVSTASSTVSLSQLPYLPPDDASLSSLRAGNGHTSRPVSLACTPSPSQRHFSLPPSSSSSPPPTGLKSLRLAPGSPLSTRSSNVRAWWTPREAAFPLPYSPPPPPPVLSRPTRAPLLRLRSLSAPVPPRPQPLPSPSCPPPTRPPRPEDALLSPATSGWSSSSSSSTSSAPSSSLFRPHLPPFLPSSSLAPDSTAPSTSSLPASSTVPILAVPVAPPRHSRTASTQTVPHVVDEDKVRALEGALEAERERAGALVDEVKRLRRVVAVLTNLPLDQDDEDEA